MKIGKQKWSPRQVTVTAVFLLAVVYGVDELVIGGSSSDSSKGKKKPKPAAAAQVPEPMAAKVPEKKTSIPVRPSQAALLEAERWSKRDWGKADPFSARSWLAQGDTGEGDEGGHHGDGALRATSFSEEGWRAVIGDRVLRVGDGYLDGRVVDITSGKVIVRGPGWEKVFQFGERE